MPDVTSHQITVEVPTSPSPHLSYYW